MKSSTPANQAVKNNQEVTMFLTKTEERFSANANANLSPPCCERRVIVSGLAEVFNKPRYNIFGLFIVTLIYERLFTELHDFLETIKSRTKRILFEKVPKHTVTLTTPTLSCVHLCKYVADIFDKKINFY